MKRIKVTEPERLSRFVKSFGGSHSQDFKGLVLKMIESGQSPTPASLAKRNWWFYSGKFST
jgi:hypothetical protein